MEVQFTLHTFYDKWKARTLVVFTKNLEHTRNTIFVQLLKTAMR